MVLQSKLFGGDSKLEAAAVSDPAHVIPGSIGPHVAKIQQALVQLDGAAISQDGAYGQGTAAAVSAFKQKRQILNFQGKIDNIVGKKTIAALDGEMLAKERGGGGGGGGGRLGFKIVGDQVFPPDVITVPKRHVLVYFSGVADDFGRGGVILPSNETAVLADMEGLTPKQGDLKSVIGFGGSLRTGIGVNQAFAFVTAVADPRGKLIIYGFSAGGVNSLELCRRINTSLPNVKVNLLVTVDVAAKGQTATLDRSVPSNVLLNRNYFQTSPSLNGSFGAPNTGNAVQNISFDNRLSTTLLVFTFNRHGEIEERSRADAVSDMRKALTT